MSDLSRRAICRVGGTALGASLAGCLGREPRGRSESGGSPVPTYKYDNARSGATETTPPGKAAEEQWAIESEFTNAFSMAGAAVSETTLYAGIGTFGHAPGGYHRARDGYRRAPMGGPTGGNATDARRRVALPRE